MINIIGIGQVGVNLGKLFGNCKEYNVITIDNSNCSINIPSLNSHLEYENYVNSNLDQIGSKLPNNSTCLLITSCGYISGINLGLIEVLLKNNNIIEIMYIKPNYTFLAPEKKQFDITSLNIYQGLTKNGIIAELIIIDNKMFSGMFKEPSIKEFYNIINYWIYYLYHMNLGCLLMEPIYSTYGSNEIDIRNEIARISTFSIVDFNNKLENRLFDIQNYEKRKYFIMIDSENNLSLSAIESLLTSLEHSARVSTVFKIVEATVTNGIFIGCKISTSEIQKEKQN